MKLIKSSYINIWNRLAETTWKKDTKQEWFHNYILYPAIAKCLIDSCVILDYGCGSGELVSFLIRRGHKVIGYDPAISMVKRARELNSGAEIYTNNRRIGKRTFDAVILNLVLSCLENPNLIIKDAKKFSNRIIFSVFHPCFSLFSDLHLTTRRKWTDSQLPNDERELYLLEPVQDVTWNSEKLTTQIWNRTLSSWFILINKNDLVIKNIIEPVPIRAGSCIKELYKRFYKIPLFLIIDSINKDAYSRIN